MTSGRELAPRGSRPSDGGRWRVACHGGETSLGFRPAAEMGWWLLRTGAGGSPPTGYPGTPGTMFVSISTGSASMPSMALLQTRESMMRFTMVEA